MSKSKKPAASSKKGNPFAKTAKAKGKAKVAAKVGNKVAGKAAAKGKGKMPFLNF